MRVVLFSFGLRSRNYHYKYQYSYHYGYSHRTLSGSFLGSSNGSSKIGLFGRKNKKRVREEAQGLATRACHPPTWKKSFHFVRCALYVRNGVRQARLRLASTGLTGFGNRKRRLCVNVVCFETFENSKGAVLSALICDSTE